MVSEQRAKTVIELRERVGESRVSMVCTKAADGALHSRPLTLREVDEGGSLWFIVAADEDWVDELRPDEQVNCTFASEDRWLSVAGRASVRVDPVKAHRLWEDDESEFSRPDDERLRLLEIRPESAEFWDSTANALKRLVLKAGRIIGRDPNTSGVIEF